MKDEQNGERAMGQLHVHGCRRRRVGFASAQRNRRAADGRAGKLRGESAERDGEDRQTSGRERGTSGLRAVPRCASALAPPSAPARIAVVATSASSVIATSQCATVAHGALPIFTVTPPRIAAANTAPTAPNAERSAPPGPPTPRLATLRKRDERQRQRP